MNEYQPLIKQTLVILFLFILFRFFPGPRRPLFISMPTLIPTFSSIMPLGSIPGVIRAPSSLGWKYNLSSTSAGPVMSRFYLRIVGFTDFAYEREKAPRYFSAVIQWD